MMQKPMQGLLVAVALALVVASVAILPAEARMTGVSGRTETGCICHGDGTPFEGVEGTLAVVPVLEGVPETYEPYESYELAVSVTGGIPYIKGGFDLNASAGTLSVADGETNVQITTEDTFGNIAGEATHITPDTRSWRVVWTAPAEGAGAVEFHLATNSVSGDSQPNQIDMWNLLKEPIVSQETNFPPVAPTVTLEVTGNTSVAVAWDLPVADLTEVQVHLSGEEGFAPGADTLVATAVPTDLGITLENLTEGATIHVRLHVVDKGGLTADSGEATASLPQPAPVVQEVVEEKGLPAPALPLVLLGLALVALRRRGA